MQVWYLISSFGGREVVVFAGLVNLTSSSYSSELLVPRGGGLPACRVLLCVCRLCATPQRLGIYSTYSPRSSIHFLAHCSNFCKPPPQKNSEGCLSNQVSAAAVELRTYQHPLVQSRYQVITMGNMRQFLQ